MCLNFYLNFLIAAMLLFFSLHDWLKMLYFIPPVGHRRVTKCPGFWILKGGIPVCTYNMELLITQ